MAVTDLEKKVLNKKSAAVVYFTELPPGTDVKEDWRHIKKLARQLKGIAPVLVMRLAEGDDFTAGELLFYPNLVTGEAKQKAAVKLPLDKENSSVTAIIDKISESYEAAFSPIDGTLFNDVVV